MMCTSSLPSPLPSPPPQLTVLAFRRSGVSSTVRRRVQCARSSAFGAPVGAARASPAAGQSVDAPRQRACSTLWRAVWRAGTRRAALAVGYGPSSGVCAGPASAVNGVARLRPASTGERRLRRASELRARECRLRLAMAQRASPAAHRRARRASPRAAGSSAERKPRLAAGRIADGAPPAAGSCMETASGRGVLSSTGGGLRHTELRLRRAEACGAPPVAG